MPVTTRSRSHTKSNKKPRRRPIVGKDESHMHNHEDNNAHSMVKSENFIQCEAITKNGKQCSREAHFQLDLKRDRIVSVFGYSITIPVSKLGIKCCHYCKAHAIEYGGTKIGNGINYIVANGLVTDAELWVAQNAADPTKELDLHRITGLAEKNRN